MKKNLYLPLLASLLFFFSSNLDAQKEKFKYADLMSFGSGPQITKPGLDIISWVDDKNYLVSKPVNSSNAKSIIKVNAETNQEEVLIDADAFKLLTKEKFALNQVLDKTGDYNIFLFQKDNDIFYLNRSEKNFKQLTDDKLEKKNPMLSPDGKKIAYTKSNNLFVFQIEDMREEQVTFDGSETILNGYASWVYYEEILGRASRYRAFYWSHDSRKIAFMRFDETNVPLFPLTIFDEVHPEIEWQRYPKAGDPNPSVKIAVYHTEENKTVWLDTDEESNNYLAWVYWSPDDSKLLYQWINRGWNNLKIFSADPFTGKSTEIYDEKQNTWVMFFDDIYFLKDHSGLIIRSSKDNFYNLYYYDYEGKLISKLTDNDFNVDGLDYIDEAKGELYFHAHGMPTWDKHFYKIKLDGSNQTKLTNESATHDCKVSLSGSYIIDRFSSAASPAKVVLLDGSGNFLRLLDDTEGKDFDNYDLGRTEMFTMKNDTGLDLPVKWILPSDFDSTKKYPVLFSVYAGPEVKEVRNQFAFAKSGFYFANNDIIYVNCDTRASIHFGKHIFGQIHKNLGRYEIDDLISLGKRIKQLPFIDPGKIGIAGGSYGGYAVLMALARGEGTFNFGISEFPVTDWRLYDNAYTERFMDKPDENAEGYSFGSVISHLNNYESGLLIIHGTMDDNVHMQNTIQIVDWLTDNNKDFELMLYPNSRHGIGFPKMHHSQRMKMKFWFNNLLNKNFDPLTD